MTDRRDFLRKLAGAGALIATAQLPSFAEDRPEVFPSRGKRERLSLSYSTVHIGLEKPFSVLHISDSHLTAAYPHENEKKLTLNKKRTTTFGGHQEEALQDAIAWAKQHVDYLVHTGDLIDWQSEANFDLVRKYFGAEYIGAVGNHEFSTDMGYSEPREEHTEAYKDNTRDLLQQVYPFDIRFQSQVANGVNFITLDDVYGYITEDQAARFRKEAEKGLPIVLCMHVPFMTEDIWRANTRFWRDKGPIDYTELPEIGGKTYGFQQAEGVTRDFIAYLRQEPLLKCILSGHLHFSTEEQFSPTCRQYVVAGGFLFHGREVIFV